MKKKKIERYFLRLSISAPDFSFAACRQLADFPATGQKMYCEGHRVLGELLLPSNGAEAESVNPGTSVAGRGSRVQIQTSRRVEKLTVACL